MHVLTSVEAMIQVQESQYVLINQMVLIEREYEETVK
jgi:hypothetical protein